MRADEERVPRELPERGPRRRRAPGVRRRSLARHLAFGACVVLLASLLHSRNAKAESPCDGPGTVVLVAFTGTRWPEELRRGVLTHLRAGLEPNGFRVCDAEDTAGTTK